MKSRTCTRNRPQSLAAIFAAAAAVAGAAGASSCATKPPPEPPQTAQLAQAVAAPERTGPPLPLPGTARAFLKTRMASHTRDMGDLVSAIMILDYDKIQDCAATISADASLARPLKLDATELASGIPERFFVLQDELRSRAATLALAAGDTSAFRVADAYGRLSETCVRCHATFRPGRE